MRIRLDRVIAVSGLVLGSACAMHRSPDETHSPRDVITQDQLRERHFNNAYDAVQALHSNWLLTKGTDSFNSPSQVLVYLDNTRMGGIETLRDIELNTVTFIKHFDGIAASGRWGLDHGQGVIYVSRRAESFDPAAAEPREQQDQRNNR